MTKPQQSDPQSWSEANVPVLTEIADDSDLSTGRMEIPDFDFSAEMDSISVKLDARAEPDLDFPPELLLDGLSVEPSTQKSGLDFNQLPSLDLSEGDADAKVDTGFEFEFESEPEGLDALMARAKLVPAPMVDEPSNALKVESALEVPAPVDLPHPDVTIPELNEVIDEVTPAPVAEMMIPELDEEVIDEVTPAPVAEMMIPALDEEVIDEVTPAPVAEMMIPALDAMVVATAAVTDVVDELAPEPLASSDAPEPIVMADEAAAEPSAALSDSALADEVVNAAASTMPFQTISLDSLPRGVLGGGSGLVPPSESGLAPNMEDLIRAAEVTLAEELRAQAQLRIEQEAAMAAAALQAISTVPAPAAAEPVLLPPVVVPEVSEPVSSTLQRETVVPSPPMIEHRPVEIINVAGLVSSGPVPAPLPPLRKSYVTLVDESMLIDSLYHKIMPRMKVELSLWLQDALDSQAKIMLSGVMHQLKEDYEMLFSETLRDSLRQAIAEMGREDRGDRF